MRGHYTIGKKTKEIKSQKILTLSCPQKILETGKPFHHELPLSWTQTLDPIIFYISAFTVSRDIYRLLSSVCVEDCSDTAQRIRLCISAFCSGKCKGSRHRLCGARGFQYSGHRGSSSHEWAINNSHAKLRLCSFRIRTFQGWNKLCGRGGHPPDFDAMGQCPPPTLSDGVIVSGEPQIRCLLVNTVPMDNFRPIWYKSRTFYGLVLFSTPVCQW